MADPQNKVGLRQILSGLRGTNSDDAPEVEGKHLNLKRLAKSLRKGQFEDDEDQSDMLEDSGSSRKDPSVSGSVLTDLGQEATQLSAPDFEQLVRDLSYIAGLDELKHDRAWARGAKLLAQAADSIKQRSGN